MVDDVGNNRNWTVGTTNNTSQHSEIRAPLLSMPEALSRATGDWVDAKVLSRNVNGNYLLRTSFGMVDIALPDDLSLRLGYDVTIRIDPYGNLTIRVPENLFHSHLSPKNTEPTPLYQRPLLSSLPLENLSPVQGRIIIPQQPQNEATRTLLSLLPQVGSGAFSLAAGLYPQLLRSGEFSRLLRQIQDTSGLRNTSHFLERIESIESAPPPKMEKSTGWLGWQLFFWDGTELRTSHWLMRDPDYERSEEDPTEDHLAVVQLHLKKHGTVQIQCFASETSWVIRLASMNTIENELLDEMQSITVFYSDLFSVSVTFEHNVGEEYYLPIVHL